jgi:DNA-binding GntR family transcriptional regulator
LDKTDKRKKKQSLRQMIYEGIKHQIITCELEPGQMLSEGEFADQYAVSKTPVREAFASLEQENLVMYVHNKGFMVTNISVKDIQEIFEARLFFESILLQLAIKQITVQELEKLEALNEVRCDPTDAESISRYLEANIEFHMGFAMASRNSRLCRLYEQLINEAQRLIYLDFKNNNIVDTWYASHKRFTDSLRNKDEIQGLQAVKDVIENGRRRMLGN